MIELAVDGFYAGDYAAMRGWAERAVAAATPLDEPALIAAALAVRAWASAVAGDGERRRRTATRRRSWSTSSRTRAGAAGSTRSHISRARSSTSTASRRQPPRQRALEIGRATGQGDLFPLIVPMLGGSLWVQGRLARPVELLDGAVEAARLAGNVQSLAWNLFNRSLAALAAGDLDLALATAEESFELGRGTGAGAALRDAAVVLAIRAARTRQSASERRAALEGAGGEELRSSAGLAGALPRAAHPRAARDGQAGRGRTCRGGGAGLRRRGGRCRGRRRWRASRRPRSP